MLILIGVKLSFNRKQNFNRESEITILICDKDDDHDLRNVAGFRIYSLLEIPNIAILKTICLSLKSLSLKITIGQNFSEIEIKIQRRNKRRSSALELCIERCSENMQQIYRRKPLPNCGFNKVAKQLYWHDTLVWAFSRKFPAYFKNTTL